MAYEPRLTSQAHSGVSRVLGASLSPPPLSRQTLNLAIRTTYSAQMKTHLKLKD